MYNKKLLYYRICIINTYYNFGTSGPKLSCYCFSWPTRTSHGINSTNNIILAVPLTCVTFTDNHRERHQWQITVQVCRSDGMACNHQCQILAKYTSHGNVDCCSRRVFCCGLIDTMFEKYAQYIRLSILITVIIKINIDTNASYILRPV